MVHPGKWLKNSFLDPLEISPEVLAELLGIPKQKIMDLIVGKVSLSPEIAARLGVFFRVPPLWFLQAQARWDACPVEQHTSVQTEVVPFGRLNEVIVTPKGVLPIRKVEPNKPIRPVFVLSSHLPRNQAEGTLVLTLPKGLIVLDHR